MHQWPPNDQALSADSPSAADEGRVLRERAGADSSRVNGTVREPSFGAYVNGAACNGYLVKRDPSSSWDSRLTLRSDLR